MLTCTLFIGALTCAEHDHAPLGSNGGDSLDSQNGSDGGSDADSDGDSDGDPDDDTDSGTGSAGCTDDEVSGPEGLRCWRRCPEGEVWEDGFCSGSAIAHDFSGASGSCGLLEGGYHSATRAELIGLLGGCADAVVDDDAEGLCDNCGASDSCYEMFGPDALTYWTSTTGEPGPWAVAFDTGAVFLAESAELPYFVRCVRPL